MKYIVISIILFALSSVAHAQLLMPDVSNSDVPAKVQAAFFDAPDMIAVAECESGMRQYAPDGSVLHGGTNGNYIGIFQISEQVHAQTALSLGYDIYSVDGNIGYARYLYTSRGSVPWISCVPKNLTPSHLLMVPVDAPVLSSAPTTTPSTETTSTPPVISPIVPTAGATTTPSVLATSTTLTLNMRLNMVDPQVQTLQQILNSLGFTISPSGPGSPGQETTKFGLLTRAAVQKFQCDHNLVCSGNEATTGFGRVGPMTRALLLKLANN